MTPSPTSSFRKDTITSSAHDPSTIPISHPSPYRPLSSIDILQNLSHPQAFPALPLIHPSFEDSINPSITTSHTWQPSTTSYFIQPDHGIMPWMSHLVSPPRTAEGKRRPLSIHLDHSITSSLSPHDAPSTRSLRGLASAPLVSNIPVREHSGSDMVITQEKRSPQEPSFLRHRAKASSTWSLSNVETPTGRTFPKTESTTATFAGEVHSSAESRDDSISRSGSELSSRPSYTESESSQNDVSGESRRNPSGTGQSDTGSSAKQSDSASGPLRTDRKRTRLDTAESRIRNRASSQRFRDRTKQKHEEARREVARLQARVKELEAKREVIDLCSPESYPDIPDLSALAGNELDMQRYTQSELIVALRNDNANLLSWLRRSYSKIKELQDKVQWLTAQHALANVPSTELLAELSKHEGTQDRLGVLQNGAAIPHTASTSTLSAPQVQSSSVISLSSPSLNQSPSNGQTDMMSAQNSPGSLSDESSHAASVTSQADLSSLRLQSQQSSLGTAKAEVGTPFLHNTRQSWSDDFVCFPSIQTSHHGPPVHSHAHSLHEHRYANTGFVSPSQLSTLNQNSLNLQFLPL